MRAGATLALGSEADCLEELTIRSTTQYQALPPQAIERLGMSQGQKNLLVRLVFRHPERSLVQAEANEMRNSVYQALHQGAQFTYA